MTNFRLIVILFFLNLSLYAQESDVDISKVKSSYITATLTSIVDPYAPRLRFGYIQHVAPHLKLGVDIGLGTEGFYYLTGTTNDIGSSYSLWEVRPELHYIFNPKAKTLKYLSAEMFYISQDHVFVDGDYTSENNGDFSFDRADFSREKYGIHIKFGLFLNVGKRLGFNFFGGIGFSVVDKQYSNVINPQPGDVFRYWDFSSYDLEGKDFLLNPSLGIKLFYKL